MCADKLVFVAGKCVLFAEKLVVLFKATVLPKENVCLQKSLYFMKRSWCVGGKACIFAEKLVCLQKSL